MSLENYLFKILEQNAMHANETENGQDTVTFDVPLLIRIFELVREDIKTDMDLHNLVERILSMKNLGVLTMQHYQDISSAHSGQDTGQMPEKPKDDMEMESLRKLAGL